jgi:hypothetical protein
VADLDPNGIKDGTSLQDGLEQRRKARVGNNDAEQQGNDRSEATAPLSLQIDIKECIERSGYRSMTQLESCTDSCAALLG